MSFLGRAAELIVWDIVWPSEKYALSPDDQHLDA